MKFKKDEFEVLLEELKRLESRAESTKLPIFKTIADDMRNCMMSYNRMSRRLMVISFSKDEKFQKLVLDLFDKRDVEGMYRLLMRCQKKE